MGLFSGLNDATIIIKTAWDNLEMSDEDLYEFINVITKENGNILNNVTSSLEEIFVILFSNRKIKDEKLYLIFDEMVNWNYAFNGKYVVNHDWINELIKNGMVLREVDRETLIKIKYNLFDYYENNNITPTSSELMLLIQMFSMEILNKKKYITKKTNIVLNDSIVTLFLKNTSTMPILEKLEFLSLCKYEFKKDTIFNVMDLGRDIIFSDYENEKKKLKDFFKKIGFSYQVSLCKTDGSLNENLTKFLNFCNKDIDYLDIFRSISTMKLYGSEVTQQLTFNGPLNEDVKNMRSILNLNNDDGPICSSLLFSILEHTKKIDYRIMCLLKTLEKDNTNDMELYKTIWHTNTNVNLKQFLKNEILKLCPKFVNYLLMIGDYALLHNYDNLDINIGFKYACIWHDFNLINYFLNQKYLPQKEHVVYVLLASKEYTSSLEKKQMQNKILSAFKSYGMIINEELFHILDMTCDFSSWNFAKELHAEITSKFKSKNSIFKNIQTMLSSTYYNYTELWYINNKKKPRENNECKFCYMFANEKLNTISAYLNNIVKNNVDSSVDCIDITKCMEYSILNPHVEVFEYVYHTYFEPKNINPSIIHIGMIFDGGRKLLMYDRFYSDKIATNNKNNDEIISHAVKKNDSKTIVKSRAKGKRNTKSKL